MFKITRALITWLPRYSAFGINGRWEQVRIKTSYHCSEEKMSKVNVGHTDASILVFLE